MKKSNYSLIDNGVRLNAGRLIMEVAVSANQQWLLSINVYTFQFKDSKEACAFISLIIKNK